MSYSTDEPKCRLQNWYPQLSNYTLPVIFVKLKKENIKTLQSGVSNKDADKDIIKRLEMPMNQFPGNCFVTVESAAPTDTDRYKGKRGAVYSADSAWKYLCKSEKIKQAALNNQAEYVCVRPFRNLNQTREFRLFVYNGKLKAMSQYHLVRHFRRLEGPKEQYYRRAKKFVNEILWLLPSENITVDIYITSDNRILVIDLNPWGEPTNPLMLNTWQQDWTKEKGIVLMKPPTKIKGDVNVSF